MISVFKFVVFIICLFSSSVYASKVNLVVASDPIVAPEALDGRYLKSVYENFEGEVFFRRVRSIPELVEALQLVENYEVQSLHFIGLHGYRYEGAMEFSVTDEEGGQLMFSMKDLKDQFIIHFSEDALIVFDSCEIIPEKITPELLASFQEIKETFNMSSGHIYGNYTNGSRTRDILLSTPFYHSNSLKEAGVKLAAQAIWPLTLAVFSYKDRFVSNNGYLYSFNEDQWEVNPAHLFSVEKGQY